MGWNALLNKTSSKWAAIACPENWKYRSTEELHSPRRRGVHALYGGGGYVANLGYDENTAGPILNDLKNNGWVDRQTRVVMVELSIFNTATRLLADVTLYFEMLPSGFLGASTRTRVMPLFKTDSTSIKVYLVILLIFAFVLGYYFVCECKRVHQLRCSYFTSMWNWLEMLQIVSAILVVVFSIIREKNTSSVLRQLNANPFAAVSFEHTLFWFEMEKVMICISVTVAVLRLLRLLKFNSHVIVLFLALKKSLRPVSSFAMVLALVFVAYGHAGVLLFGKSVYMLSSFQRVNALQFLMSLGSPAPRFELEQANRTFARLYYLSFLSLTMIILINMFVAMLNDAQTESTSSARDSEDMEVANLLLLKLLKFFGMKKEHSSSANEGDETSTEPTGKEVQVSLVTDPIDMQTRQMKVSVTNDTRVTKTCAAKTSSSTNDPCKPLDLLGGFVSHDEYEMPSTPQNSLHGQSDPSEPLSRLFFPRNSFHRESDAIEPRSVSSERYRCAFPSIHRNSFDGQNEPSQFFGASRFSYRCEMSPRSHSSYGNTGTANLLGSSTLNGEQNGSTGSLRYWLSPACSTLSLTSQKSFQTQRQPSELLHNSRSPDMYATSSTSRNSFDAQWVPSNVLVDCLLPDRPSTRNSFEAHYEPERLALDSYLGQSHPLDIPGRSSVRDRFEMPLTSQNLFNSESCMNKSSIVNTDKKTRLESDITHTVHFASEINVRQIAAVDSGSDSVDHPDHPGKKCEAGGSGEETTDNDAIPVNKSGGPITTAQTSESPRLVSDEAKAKIIDFEEITEWMKEMNSTCNKVSLGSTTERSTTTKRSDSSHPVTVDFDEVSAWMKKTSFSRNMYQQTNASQNSKKSIIDFDALSKMMKKTRNERKRRDATKAVQLENRAKKLQRLLEALDLPE